MSVASFEYLTLGLINIEYPVEVVYRPCTFS